MQTDVLQPLEDVVHRRLDRHLLPVGQKVDGDEIDMVGQFGVAHPDIGRLGGTHRQGGTPTDPVEVGDHLRHGHIATQQGLVAHHDPDHVAVALGQHLGQTIQFLVVFLRVRPDPGPHRDIEAVLARQMRHLGQGILDRVGPHRMDRVLEQGQVLIDLLDLRVDVFGRIAVGAHGGEGEPLQLGRPHRFLGGLIEQGPGDHGQEGNQERKEDVAGRPHWAPASVVINDVERMGLSMDGRGLAKRRGSPPAPITAQGGK